MVREGQHGRLVRTVIGATAVIALSGSGIHGQEPSAQPAPAQQTASQAGTQQQASQKLTFSGDLALWTVAIKPDKTAAFEQIMGRVRDALAKSSDPVRQRQAAGWKVMKIEKPMPDGNIAYVHVISPVIPEADYTVMQILYDAFPDERLALYEMYRDAFAANLSMATGRVAVDLAPGSSPQAVAAR